MNGNYYLTFFLHLYNDRLLQGGQVCIYTFHQNTLNCWVVLVDNRRHRCRKFYSKLLKKHTYLGIFNDAINLKEMVSFLY
jgi:hypothetical protein